MTPAHRARLIAALTLETGLPWRQCGRGAHCVATDRLFLERMDGSRRDHSPPCTVLGRHGIPSSFVYFDYEPSGRGWPERLAVEVAKKIKEVDNG